MDSQRVIYQISSLQSSKPQTISILSRIVKSSCYIPKGIHAATMPVYGIYRHQDNIVTYMRILGANNINT